MDIRGLTLEDALGAYTIAAAAPLWVESGGYFVLGRNGSSAHNGGVQVDHVYGEVTLNNGGDVITLSYQGTVIDSIAYDEASGFPLSAGVSIINDALLPGSSTDWCSSSSSFGGGDFGSPGAQTALVAPRRARIE